jgi:hypothetical protein
MCKFFSEKTTKIFLLLFKILFLSTKNIPHHFNKKTFIKAWPPTLFAPKIASTNAKRLYSLKIGFNRGQKKRALNYWAPFWPFLVSFSHAFDSIRRGLTFSSSLFFVQFGLILSVLVCLGNNKEWVILFFGVQFNLIWTVLVIKNE